MARTQISANLLYPKSVYLQSILQILKQYILLLLLHTDLLCHVVYKNLASTHNFSRIHNTLQELLRKVKLLILKNVWFCDLNNSQKCNFTQSSNTKREILEKYTLFPENLSESFRSHFGPSQSFLTIYCTYYVLHLVSFSVSFTSLISLSALKY